MDACDSGAFVPHDPCFAEVTGPKPRLHRLIETDAHEGPVYVRDEDALYFTSVPADTDLPAPRSRQVAIRRLQLNGADAPRAAEDLTTVRMAANMANGTALDSGGWLLVCEQGTHSEHGRISRFDPHAACVETVVDEWCGLRLNSPNDVVQKRDGSIWFTDPSYGFLQGSNQSRNWVTLSIATTRGRDN
jgi:gluconolactonase